MYTYPNSELGDHLGRDLATARPPEFVDRAIFVPANLPHPGLHDPELMLDTFTDPSPVLGAIDSLAGHSQETGHFTLVEFGPSPGDQKSFSERQSRHGMGHSRTGTRSSIQRPFLFSSS